MNIRDLVYLTAVAEHRHFGRAAQECHVSQPTLSTQIKKLEETLGVTLFERTNRQVMLTPVGERVVAQARRVLDEVDGLTRIADEHRDPFGGELRLGIIPTVAPYLLPKVIRPVRTAFSKLRLLITEGQTATVTDLLTAGKLDAVIVALPFDADHCECVELYREPFYFAASRQHPKADRKRITLDDLQNEEVLLLEDGHCLRDQALEICKTHHATENSSYRATSIETLRHLVAADVGITLMPEMAVTPRAAGVKYVRFQKPEPSRRIGLCWRSSSPRDELMRALAQKLVQIVA